MSAVILTPVAVGERTGLALKTLANWRCLGTGPKWFRLGRLVRYYEADLDRWIGSLPTERRA